MNNVGKIVQIIGPVLDIKFEDGELPNILNAIEIDNKGQRLVAEEMCIRDRSCDNALLFYACVNGNACNNRRICYNKVCKT